MSFRIIRSIILLGILISTISQLLAQTSVETLMKKAWEFKVGSGAAEHQDSAVYYWYLAALKGDPEANYLAGVALLYGESIKRDVKLGFSFLQKASDKSYMPATLLMAKIRLGPDEHDPFENPQIQALKYPSKGLKLAITAAEAGETEGAWHSGKCYYYGIGTSKNDSLAWHYLYIAAKKGHPDAQNVIAEGLWKYRFKKQGTILDCKYWYQQLQKNPKADITMQSYGLIGWDRADQMERKIHNFLLRPVYTMSPNAFRYTIRKK